MLDGALSAGGPAWAGVPSLCGGVRETAEGSGTGAGATQVLGLVGRFSSLTAHVVLHLSEFNTTFVMHNEDHTLGNALRMMLNQNPKVALAQAPVTHARNHLALSPHCSGTGILPHIPPQPDMACSALPQCFCHAQKCAQFVALALSETRAQHR